LKYYALKIQIILTLAALSFFAIIFTACMLGDDIDTLRDKAGRGRGDGDGNDNGGDGNDGWAVGSLIESVWVPAGSFTMGSDDLEDWDARPTHQVTLTKGFWMGKYQVTQEQYEAVMGYNPSLNTTDNGNPPAPGETDNRRPVENVNWYEAILFCNKLSIKEGLSPAYSKNGSTNPDDWGPVADWIYDSTWDEIQIVEGSAGYRLPTEAQWEYAAKGAKNTEPYFIFSGSDNADEVAWYGYNSGSNGHDGTREVGKKQANELGIYDMSGNVWEWCWNWWEPYTSDEKIDPVGPLGNPSSTSRYFRGGSWLDLIGSVRSAGRGGNDPGHQHSSLGFRVIRPYMIEMVWVPAGSFTMGSNDPNDYNAQPAHQVNLTKGFWMGKYQVTQEQYEDVMGHNPSYFTTANGQPPASGENDRRRPVEQVSWYDVILFCNKLSIMEGLSPAYRINGSTNPNDWGNVPDWYMDSVWDAVQIVEGSMGYRLPTEAQWEYAAKGAKSTGPYFIYSGSNYADDVAWYWENSGGQTREVGKKAPNELGIYDMSGNVWEWCWNWWEEYTSSAKTDPMGPLDASSWSFRVLRGGGWGYSVEDARSAIRGGWYGPNDRYFSIGFRVLRP